MSDRSAFHAQRLYIIVCTQSSSGGLGLGSLGRWVLAKLLLALRALALHTG